MLGSYLFSSYTHYLSFIRVPSARYIYTSCMSNQILHTSQHAYALNSFIAWSKKKMLLSYKTSFKPPPPLLIYFYNCLLKHTAEFFLIGTRKQNIVYLPEMYIVMYTVYTAYCTVLCIALVNIILSLSFL